MTRAERLAVVIQFAETVLASARDTLGPEQTPLFLDGLEMETREPVRWLREGEEWVPANPASQQMLYRTLVGLSALSGDARYRQSAVDAMTFVFERFPRSCGLLQWGGHRLWDAAGDRFVGEGDKHELKCNYPYYELMWELNPAATARYIKAFWNAHILDWGNLDENRHGNFDKPMGLLWENDYHGGPPFFVGKGLTFINCGSDLVLAAAMLFHYEGDTGALTWAKRMAHRYVEARNSDTGLGAYQYSQIANDRARIQFGPEFGERLLEGTMLDTGRALTIYGRAALVWMRIAEALGEAGEDFLRWAREGLAAYARWAYDPETNTCFAVITDGTRLTSEDMKREGYYGASTLAQRPAGGPLFLSYALAARLTGDDFLWQTARSIALGNDLGDIGAAAGQGVRVNRETSHGEASALLGVLELWRGTGVTEYLDLAEAIGDNLIRKHYRAGLFVPSADHVYTRVDALEPLALLSLEAALRGQPELVPLYTGGTANFTCPYDGVGRRQENDLIYARKR